MALEVDLFHAGLKPTKLLAVVLLVLAAASPPVAATTVTLILGAVVVVGRLSQSETNHHDSVGVA